MDDFVVLGLLVMGVVIGGFVLGIIGFFKAQRLERSIYEIKRQISSLSTSAVNVALPTKVDQAEVAASKPEIEIPPEPITEKIEAVSVDKTEPRVESQAPTRDLERNLASRWFVWVGGVAVSLAGLLFVKYAHEQGLISPFLRVLIGLLIAAGLVAAGEYVRRSRGTSMVDYVPAALSAAGLVMGFGVVYAAYGLYDLVSPGVDFIGLGLVAMAAFWLSRVQGPLIAALGLLGAYSAPALVTSTDPNAWSFFPYLLVIVATSFFTLRGRNWWWLGYLSIAGAMAWGLLWIGGGAFNAGDVWPIGAFAIALGLGATLMFEGRAIFAEESGSLVKAAHMSQPLSLAICGMAAGVALLAAQVFETQHGFTALVLFLIGMCLVAAFSWFKNGVSVAALLAALCVWVVFIGWPEVAFHEWAFDEHGFWTTVPGLTEPPRFVNWMIVGLIGFTGLGTVGYLKKQTAQPWAALAAGASFMFLLGAWGRADFVWSANSWAVFGGLLMALLMALAWMKRSALSESEAQFGISSLVVGAAMLGLFALDRLFDDIWFTIAIALFAAAVAYLSKLIPARLIGATASALGSFAAARLFVSREIWGEGAVYPWGGHWPIYGYGIPAITLFVASRWLNNQNYRREQVALEGISLALFVSLVSLELRTLIGGDLVGHDMTLLEMSAHILSWLGMAYGLAYRQHLFSSYVSLWGSRALLFGSCAAIIVMSLLLLNPLATGDQIQGNILFNSLTMAYLAPVVLLALIARKLDAIGLGWWRNGVGILALVLSVAYVTMQTKMAFQGKYIIPEFSSDAESYALSAAWLVLSILLFVVGLKLERKNIRLGGMVVMVLALLKAFGYDLWEIGGLWRIASLLGLGLCLIGVGWLYTRFVHEPKKLEAV
jgi:uncharacterized membrane protein